MRKAREIRIAEDEGMPKRGKETLLERENARW
jgi:hypothetical protein